MGNKKNEKRRLSRPKARTPPCKKSKKDLVEQENQLMESSSASKLQKTATVDSSSGSATTSTTGTDNDLASDLGNSIVDMNLLVDLLKLFPCLECGGETLVSVENLGGLAQRVDINCGACSYVKQQNLSKPLGKLQLLL